MDLGPVSAKPQDVGIGRILIVDDEPDFVDTLGEVLAATGLAAETTTDPRDALDRVTRGDYALLIADLVMPEMDGMELLRRARAASPRTDVVIVTGYGTVEAAVEAIRSGAADFLTKPFDARRIVEVISRVTELRRLRDENQTLRAELTGRSGAITPPSAAMRRAFEVARELASSEAPLLILGEVGSGRETLAELVHARGARAAGPLVRVNCSALPAKMQKTEIFGRAATAQARGARARAGRLELADGGTLFLDEVQELSSSAQERLLQFLREGRFRRAGGEEYLTADVRLLAAAGPSLDARVRSGEFSAELRAALGETSIRVPALRERREDIPAHAAHFLALFSARGGGAGPGGFSPQALDALMDYAWPGNVAELKGAVERAAVFAGSGQVLPEHLPPEVRSGSDAWAVSEGGPEGDAAPGTRPLAEVEREAIRTALLCSGGNLSRAARELGVSRTSLYDRMARYGLSRPPRGNADKAYSGEAN
jgi:DNA-binding NtrC family response regulator